MSGATGLVTHPSSLRHRTGPGHVERPRRIEAVLAALEADGFAGELARAEPEAAPIEVLERVHERAYLDRLRQAIEGGVTLLDDGDTTCSGDSWDAALHAAGAGLLAVERVVSGDWRRAFCAIRPPGHHAERDRAMGFCLLSNAAIAARHATRALGLARVAIVDFDVHHGNGTQHLTERDPDLFYASLHQYPHYPGTGAADERGLGEGEGTVLNCPLAAGTGDLEWRTALEGAVLPALEEFDPELVILSAGFDAHRDDPLSGTLVTTEGFRTLTRALVRFADTVCGGRIVSLLEGGYDLEALAASARAHVEELAARA